jgi:methylmalonyl-CoA mutase N-terminal domain/subunit
VVVGVNKYVDAAADQPVETHRLDPESERRQVERLRRVRAERDEPRWERALKELAETARDPGENLMPATSPP